MTTDELQHHTVRLVTDLVRERVKADRGRVVDAIRDLAEEVKGKTWYHPELELGLLAQRIEDLL